MADMALKARRRHRFSRNRTCSVLCPNYHAGARINVVFALNRGPWCNDIGKRAFVRIAFFVNFGMLKDFDLRLGGTRSRTS